MVVAGNVFATDIKVNGDVYLGNGTTQGFTVLQLNSCNINTTDGSGALDFTSLQYAALNASYYLANQNPTTILDSEGNLRYILNDTNITSSNPCNSVKFYSCNQPGSCGVSADDASSPQVIFFWNGSWNGPEGENFLINHPFVLM
jgi:hypothetical protein